MHSDREHVCVCNTAHMHILHTNNFLLDEIYLSIHPSIHPFIDPSIDLSIHLSIHPSIHLPPQPPFSHSVQNIKPSPIPFSWCFRCWLNRLQNVTLVAQTVERTFFWVTLWLVDSDWFWRGPRPWKNDLSTTALAKHFLWHTIAAETP